MTIGCVVNFYREPYALPSFFGPAAAMFDQVVFVHSPPYNAPYDESVEIVEAAGFEVIRDTVEDGFGKLRSRCIRYSDCDWVVIMDADERMWANPPHLTPQGEEVWPGHANPQNSATAGPLVDQRAMLRRKIEQAEGDNCLALCMVRRHWMDAPLVWGQPCQNWIKITDWQLRCVKNSPFVAYDPFQKMHERLLDVRTWDDPRHLKVLPEEGPYFDHYHHHFKGQEPSQNSEDIAIYERLEPGVSKNMWINHQPQEKQGPKSPPLTEKRAVVTVPHIPKRPDPPKKKAKPTPKKKK